MECIARSCRCGFTGSVWRVGACTDVRCSVLPCVAACFSVLQRVACVACVAVCCVVLQRCNVFFVRVDANYTASMCPTGDYAG